MSNGSEEIRRGGNGSNWPGFDYPLQFCPIRPKHRDAMVRAVWASHRQLRGFIGWAKYTRNWNDNNFDEFVNSHINATLPNQHFVFTLGEEIVGVGSLVSAYTDLDTQIALWIRTGYQGKGIGQAIVQTLEHVAFSVWGFETLYYEHDSQNEASKKLPQKCGFTLSHTRDLKKTAQQESGFWFSWKKHRPGGLPDAIIQGRPIDDFTTP